MELTAAEPRRKGLVQLYLDGEEAVKLDREVFLRAGLRPGDQISDEELEFITGCASIEEALPKLLTGNTAMVIYTKGSEGAECYTAGARASALSQKVKAVDTTGAGDGFIGSFLYRLASLKVTAENLSSVAGEELEACLKFANAFCGISVTKHGAIASYPTMEEMKEWV